MHDDTSPQGTTLAAGVVEGFYGPPWSRDQRLATIPFLAAIGMTFYIYAPKEDRRHREKWSDGYGTAEVTRFCELAEVCRREGIAFNFALSPGLSIEYGSRKDRRMLLDKYLAAVDWGATECSLFLDDIPPGLKESADKREFSDFAQAQADLANATLDGLTRRFGNKTTLLFCPTEYAGMNPSPYLERLGRELDGRIPVFWTGPQVVSPTISCADARAFAALIGRKPFLWDNYPVNDFAPNRLFLGPLRGREQGLVGELSGYAANPMNQPRASRIALRTLADWLADPERYEPTGSWESAVRTTWREAVRKTGAGAGPALEEAFRLAASQFVPSPLEEDQRTPLSRQAGETGEEAAALEEAATLEAAAEKLLRCAGAIPLVAEISGWLRDILLRCRTLRGSRRAAALSAGKDVKNALKTAAETWRDRELVGRRHTLASGDEMRAADAVLLPPLRRSGKILFEFTENVGDRRRWTLLDAGRPFLASRILILFGRPFRIDPPEEPPTLEASLDGVLFFPLPLRPVEEGAVADTEGKAIRFLRVGGPDGHHAYILLHNTRHMQRKDREEPPDR